MPDTQTEQITSWISVCALHDQQRSVARTIKVTQFGDKELRRSLRRSLPGTPKEKTAFLRFAYFIGQVIRFEIMTRGEWVADSTFAYAADKIDAAKKQLTELLERVSGDVLFELSEQIITRGNAPLEKELLLPASATSISDWRIGLQQRNPRLGSYPLCIGEMWERWILHLDNFQQALRPVRPQGQTVRSQTSVTQGLILLMIAWHSIFRETPTFKRVALNANDDEPKDSVEGKILDFTQLFFANLRSMKLPKTQWVAPCRDAWATVRDMKEFEPETLFKSFLKISTGYEPVFDRLFGQLRTETTSAEVPTKPIEPSPPATEHQ